MPGWARLLPFVASAVLFVSAFFAILAPLPLVLIRLRSGIKWFFVALSVNALLVAIASGPGALGVYLLFIGVIGGILGAGFDKGWRVEKTAALCFAGIFLGAIAWLTAHAFFHHVGIGDEFKRQLAAAAEMMAQVVATGPEGFRSGVLGGMELAEWKENLVVEIPGALAVFSLITIVLNLLVVVRLNPSGIREKCGLDPSFFVSWKAPEFLVWPTLATGFLLLLNLGSGEWLVSAAFKTLMTVYALHGLSILAFFLGLWRIRGGLRTALLVMAIFLMTPLLLSLGFFDLWFDFRSKFRQS